MTNQEKTLVISEVSGWLRVFDDGSVDRTWTGPSEAQFMTEPLPPHEDYIDGVAVRDLGSTTGPQVRVYMPETRPHQNEKLPVVMHFPGGGFCITEANWFIYYAFYSKLARLGRVIVVSVYLRRGPEHRLPAAVDDGYSAFLWLASLAQGVVHEPWLTDHANFERVFLMGDSSGANVVHQVGARAGETNLSPLKLVGLIPANPGFVRSTRSRSEQEMPQTPMLTLDMVDKLLELALPIGSNKDHPITCPMGSAAPPLSGLHLPPMMYCVAEKDLMVDTQMEYYEALKQAGKDVELFVGKNMTHCYYLEPEIFSSPESKAQIERLYEAIIDFINKH